MQDTATGRMYEAPIDERIALEKKFGSLRSAPQADLRKAFESLIPRERQGPVFFEGETIEIKGRRFTVRKIIDKGLVLHGVPEERREGTSRLTADSPGVPHQEADVI